VPTTSPPALACPAISNRRRLMTVMRNLLPSAFSLWRRLCFTSILRHPLFLCERNCTVKPMMIIPPGLMHDNDIEALRNNDICVVVASEPDKVREVASAFVSIAKGNGRETNYEFTDEELGAMRIMASEFKKVVNV